MLLEKICNVDFKLNKALEHCCGIVPNVFFRLSFRDCKSCVYNCDDHCSFNSSLRSSHIWFSYIHNFIVSNSYNIAKTLQRCVALKMIVWNRPITFMLPKNAKYASLFAIELGKFFVYAGPNHSFVSNKYVCQALYQTSPAGFFTITPPYLKETRLWDKQQKWTLINARLTSFQKP